MNQNASLTLAACGDILLHGRYAVAAAAGAAGPILERLAPLLEGADLVVGNLETVVATGGEPRADKLCLRTDPAWAGALAQAGFHLLTLANNHSLDYGPEGLAETRRHLAAAGIAVIGAGADLAEAAAPVIIERNGLRAGFLAACHESTRPSAQARAGAPGVAPFDPEALLAAVDDLRPRVDHVVLLLHWGLEYAHYPTPEQVAFARRAIERGVSAVIGHHSHSLQGIERYRGGLIAYSLANLTDAAVDWQGPTRRYQADLTEVDRESILLRLRLTREAVELIDTPPLWLDDAGRPGPAPAERAGKIRQALAEHCARLESGDLEAFWQESVIESRVTGPLVSWWRSGSLWDKVRGFRPGQVVTLYLLARTWLAVRFGRSESRWLLINPRNDTRPMPSSHTRKKAN